MTTSSQGPQPGEISTDGQFQWTGQEWQPLARGHREPTSWTQPMQGASAVYLVLSAVQALITSALFLNVPSIERSTRAANPSLTDDQLRQAANLGVTLGWATVIVVAVAALILAFGALRGWRWAFWVVLAWLALSSIGVVTNLVALGTLATQSQPAGSILVSFVFSVAALALLVWFIVASIRYGPWATRKLGA